MKVTRQIRQILRQTVDADTIFTNKYPRCSTVKTYLHNDTTLDQLDDLANELCQIDPRITIKIYVHKCIGKSLVVRVPVELVPDRKKCVKSLMSGKRILIDEKTPLCCDPSSETYWSM